MIVDAALALLGEEGLDQISLRKVAAKLNVKAPSLYWHVSDKGNLLAIIAESVFARCVERMPPCSTWQQWLREFGLSLWRAQSDVRDIGRLILIARQPDERLEELTRDLAVRLGALGVRHDRAVAMQSSVQALVTGWSGFAQGPNAEFLRRIVDVERAFGQGLDAMIRGFEAEPGNSVDAREVRDDA
jgi:TetR/AcrR family tetracycline transcriptional repressor